jgi:diaminopimelate decarboxylase
VNASIASSYDIGDIVLDQKYVPPVISGELGCTTSRVAEDRNFYAHGSHVPALSQIDGVSIAGLVKEFGSPLFVFSEHNLREKARHLRDAFKSRYPATSFAWSFKTNYLGAICQIFRDEGWIAEVVSDFEYEKACKLGFSGSEIVFNGPHKPRAILERAVKEGALIQIDNWDELNTLEDLTRKSKKPVEVGVRVWLDAGIQPVWTKFGFALANGEAERAATRIVKNPKLVLHTLHAHIGTYVLSPEAYGVATQSLLVLREHIQEKHRHLISCLNLGGGFPSATLLHGMTGPAEQAVPPIEAYARAITDVLNKLPAKKRPLLRLESGRCLVDEAGHLLASVVAVKGTNRPAVVAADLSAREYKERLILGGDARVNYIVDAGINLLYTGAWYRFDVLPSKFVDVPPIASRIYGSLCMSIDVLRDNVDLPPLETGDILTFRPVGAYNVTQSMQFIQYRPAVVLISNSGKSELIRMRETLADVDGPERMPAHLLVK